MTKKEYCIAHESIAYYSGLNGLEIKGVEYCFCNITVKPYKGRKYNPAFVWVCVG